MVQGQSNVKLYNHVYTCNFNVMLNINSLVQHQNLGSVKCKNITSFSVEH